MDDSLIFSIDKRKIDFLIDNLGKTFRLTIEGSDVNMFLGIKVEKGDNGSITIIPISSQKTDFCKLIITQW